MSTRRKKHSAAFKVQVAIEAINETLGCGATTGEDTDLLLHFKQQIYDTVVAQWKDK
jgi:hypothetical protein